MRSQDGRSDLRAAEADDPVGSRTQLAIPAAAVVFGFAAGGESGLAALLQIGRVIHIIGMPVASSFCRYSR